MADFRSNLSARGIQFHPKKDRSQNLPFEESRAQSQFPLLALPTSTLPQFSYPTFPSENTLFEGLFGGRDDYYLLDPQKKLDKMENGGASGWAKGGN